MRWRVLGLGVLLAMTVACRKPERALRERPMEGVQVVSTESSIPPELLTAAADRLAAKLGVPVIPREPAANARVLRVEVEKLKPSRYVGAGPLKTVVIDGGVGALVGGLLASGAPFYTFTSPQITAAGVGVGFLAGLAHSPWHFRNNQQQLTTLGYLPWELVGKWSVLELAPAGMRAEVAESHLPALKSEGYLVPASDAEGARQATLFAYMDALAEHVRAQKPGK